MTAKRHFQLNEQQEQDLKAAFKESGDGILRTRLQAVRLYGSGYAVADIIATPAVLAGHCFDGADNTFVTEACVWWTNDRAATAARQSRLVCLARNHIRLLLQ